MPELPDVEVFGRRIRDRGLNRRLETVDLRDPERLRGGSTSDLESALRGYAFEAVHRHGKMLFVKVSSNWQLVMHFGMTGFATFYNEPSDEPGHARLVLEFDDGWFALDDRRRLGWLELVDDIPSYLRSQRIGPDALSYDEKSLRAYFAGKHGSVKAALMDQEKIAGIGNIYSDEILFHAGVRPERKAADLTESEIKAIHARMGAVLRAALDRDADPAKMPHDWLTPHRGTDHPCPRCGRALKKLKVSGRTAYFCPQCQS